MNTTTGWRIAVGGVLATAALLLTACGSSGGTGGSGAADGKKITIAFVAGEANNVFYQTMEGPAKAEAAKLGATIIWEPPPTFSAPEETPILQSLLAQHPSALIVTPDDPVAMAAPIRQYVAAKIPVITVDTTLQDSSLVTSQITSDNSQGGSLAASFIGQGTHAKGATFAVGSTTTTQTMVSRANAFDANISQKYPPMALYPVQYDNDNETNAVTVASSMLIAHKNLTGIFGTNNVAVEGIARAVQQANLNGKIEIVGYDADPTEVGLLKSGAVSALVIQQPALEARLAVEYAVDAVEGKTSAIKKSVELPNIIATTANAKDPSISKYFYG